MNPTAPTHRRPTLGRPNLGHRVLTASLLALATAALLHPALWNGFPLLFFDTGGYVQRVIRWDLEPGRSLFYGLFLWSASLGWLSLWGPVVAQAALCLWTIRLLLRAEGLSHGAGMLLAVSAVLAAATGIGWYAGQLMPDVLVPLLVLALWLLGFRWDRLTWPERLGLVAVAQLALLSHMSSMAQGLGLVAVTAAVVAARLLGWPGPNGLRPRLLPPALAVLASFAIMPLGHLALVGHATFTPGGAVFVFGRTVQDGIAQRLLADRCPADPQAYILCPYRDRMPTTANDFIWHWQSPFRDIGGWQAEPELARMVKDSVAAYPGMHVRTAIAASWRQFAVKLHTGDGLDEYQEVTRWIVAGDLPAHNPAFLAARQQREQITQGLFDALNAVHVPVAWLSLLALAAAILWGVRQRRVEPVLLAGFVLLALAGNAFITGALSNPHDRYQSRLVWLAMLAAGVAWARLRQPGVRDPAR